MPKAKTEKQTISFAIERFRLKLVFCAVLHRCYCCGIMHSSSPYNVYIWKWILKWRVANQRIASSFLVRGFNFRLQTMLIGYQRKLSSVNSLTVHIQEIHFFEEIRFFPTDSQTWLLYFVLTLGIYSLDKINSSVKLHNTKEIINRRLFVNSTVGVSV